MKLLAKPMTILALLGACRSTHETVPAATPAAPRLPALSGAWVARRFAGENSGPMREILLVLAEDGGYEACALIQEGPTLGTQRRTARYELQGDTLQLRWTDFLDGSPKENAFRIEATEGGGFSLEDAQGKAYFEPWGRSKL